LICDSKLESNFSPEYKDTAEWNRRWGAHRGCHERRIIGGAFFVIFKDQGAVCLVRPIVLICQHLPIAKDTFHRWNTATLRLEIEKTMKPFNW
jgi:hypothetical protein